MALGMFVFLNLLNNPQGWTQGCDEDWRGEYLKSAGNNFSCLSNGVTTCPKQEAKPPSNHVAGEKSCVLPIRVQSANPMGSGQKEASWKATDGAKTFCGFKTLPHLWPWHIKADRKPHGVSATLLANDKWVFVKGSTALPLGWLWLTQASSQHCRLI